MHLTPQNDFLVQALHIRVNLVHATR
uniref:Uncharacterized protein n=1 Tax=Rhizophora mucronata TaxID=61149 RepID=A0A2P2N8U4_RHIMU